ncbi:hypothetical protein CROQUDRAFT_664333 [Cronartium quercuum f. sp. fusiforme G11]|uniref:Uncharacterized protein n=1 Tax=Cronartium quercuum f. sp. fusiforme G11 TaxID=708437 RepID=A0A9P6N7G3_9BASI|nr:hypothetical protein CROQUDRAFT_664333 [Cronartium quercuum f. sp. fusiforme G11]
MVIRRLLNAYTRLLKERTLFTQVTTAGIIFPTSDAIAQHLIDKKAWIEHDYARTLRYVVYGALAWTPIANRWHAFLNSIVFSTPFRTMVGRIATDMTIFAPFATAYFFTTMGIMEGKSWQDIRTGLNMNMSSVTLTNISVFGPAQVINLSFMPLHARPPFLNCVSLGYNCFLATVNHPIKSTESQK